MQAQLKAVHSDLTANDQVQALLTMMERQNSIIDIVKEYLCKILEDATSINVNKDQLYLFGSRGTAVSLPNSDLDICLRLPQLAAKKDGANILTSVYNHLKLHKRPGITQLTNGVAAKWTLMFDLYALHVDWTFHHGDPSDESKGHTAVRGTNILSKLFDELPKSQSVAVKLLVDWAKSNGVGYERTGNVRVRTILKGVHWALISIIVLRTPRTGRLTQLAQLHASFICYRFSRPSSSPTTSSTARRS